MIGEPRPVPAPTAAEHNRAVSLGSETASGALDPEQGLDFTAPVGVDNFTKKLANGARRNRRIGAIAAVLTAAAIWASKGGIMKKYLMACSLLAGSLAFGNAAGVAQEVEKLPPSGTTHFTTYFSVHPAHVVEMVDNSSITVAELVGITVNPDGEPYFDNMVVHCLVTIRVVKGEQDLYGACKETDKDGDYTSTTFDSKAHYFIGGTGKYKGITGEAPFTVEALPAPGEGLGALIIPHEVTWKLE